STLWSRVIKAIHGRDGKIGIGSINGTKSCWLSIVNEINVLAKKSINLMDFMHIKLGNGDSTAFWEDLWCADGRLKDRYPRAYSLETCKSITVSSKLMHPSLAHSFRRDPRGGVEKSQLEELTVAIQAVSLTSTRDRWVWALNGSGDFSVSSIRNLIDSRVLPKGDLKTKWIRHVPIKVNIFAWKVMTNSLPTRFNISRRGIDIDSISCVNCEAGVETTNHIFFSCDTAKQVSRLISRWWDIHCIEIDSYGSWLEWMGNIRMPAKNKSMLEGVFFVNWWFLWNCRNKNIFEGQAFSKETFFDDIVPSFPCGVVMDVMVAPELH
ncbi:RNA-directed DNA polymerase, eukaryota, reverse transcriptase zinc-binding domain protein, partial [Tanacetum coccineum]